MNGFPVRFRWADVVVQSFANDVTESGMFVSCPIPPPKETRLPLRLFLPDGCDPEPVDVVVRAAATSGPAGFRCDLIGLTPAGRERLRGALPRPQAEAPVEAPEELLRELKPVPPATGSALADIVLGALDGGENEVAVKDLLEVPTPRPLPPRAPARPREAATAEPRPVPVLARERRAVPRAAIHFKLKFGNARTFVEHQAADLSAGGLFVATARDVPVGTLVQLTLSLPDGLEPVEAQARVVRRAGPADPQPGVGLQFLGENAKLATRVQQLVACWSPP